MKEHDRDIIDEMIDLALDDHITTYHPIPTVKPQKPLFDIFAEEEAKLTDRYVEALERVVTEMDEIIQDGDLWEHYPMALRRIKANLRERPGRLGPPISVG